MNKNKYLVISMSDMHHELLDSIKKNARKEKLTVSQYVRNLLYNSLMNENSSIMDDRRAAISMGDGVRQSFQ